jgi:hypothetical protein
MKKFECYHNKFGGIQCHKKAVWKGLNADDYTDKWTWCDEHSPPPEYREPIKAEEEDDSHQ